MSIRIVLATDASSHAQSAIDMVRNIQADDANVTVTSVANVEKPFSVGPHTWPVHSDAWQMYEKEKDEAMMAATRRVNVAVDQLKRTGWHLDGMVQWGDPAECILEVVQDRRADLLFVGSRGLGTVEGWLLGSVSQRLVGSAPCAVCIVRPASSDVDKEGGNRIRILLATDGSQDAEAAADLLGAIGIGSSSDLAVLNVIPSHVPPTIGFDLTPLSSISDEAIQQGQSIADTISATLQPDFKQATPMTRKGDPADEIIKAATEWKADLIAISSRGLSRVKAFFIGSVSQKVATYAPCSVLVVRNQMTRLREETQDALERRTMVHDLV